MPTVYHNGAEIRIVLYCPGRQVKIYDAYLEKGNWPTDGELISMCKLGRPNSVFLGDGQVLSGDSIHHKIVHIFKR